MATITVAGATGNMGGRIVRALLDRGAYVRALIRAESAGARTDELENLGVEVVPVDLADPVGLARGCAGADCVVSALQGLRGVIVAAQANLLDAAVEAGVPRFIPSDYSADYTKCPEGSNRNLDLRREFGRRLDGAPIRGTSVLNGAFADMLLWGQVILRLAERRVEYWADADQPLDFTTMDDTASATAAAALDPAAPRLLRVAGDQISARGLADAATEVTGTPFELTHLGDLADLAGIIARERAGDPATEGDLFPRWQAAQYLHNMFGGCGKLDPVENGRYPDIRWTTARDVIARASGR